MPSGSSSLSFFFINLSSPRCYGSIPWPGTPPFSVSPQPSLHGRVQKLHR